jgi:hypothetical protein
VRLPPALALAATLAFAVPAGAQLLDKQAILARQPWWDDHDRDWYARNVPFLETPDPDIDATYWYRWEVVTRHLTYGSPETGYTFTEFIDRPFWSGAHGAISCPLGHQMYELRWLKDRRIVDDFARYWHETPGAEPRSYSNWFGDAVWATYLVNADREFIAHMLPSMERQYAGWVAERYDAAHGLFKWDGLHDGMEQSINSRQTDDHETGAEGYRPTLNSYLYADAMAIASAAALLGDSAKAAGYRARAAAIRQRVHEQLWDPRRQFFLHQFARDERDGIRAKTRTYETGKYAGDPHGRELLGYVPWQFGVADAAHDVAWKFLMDTAHFAAPFGPTTAERGDPLFLVSPRCCYWSGNSWPYATTQVLVAMANLLNAREQPWVTKRDYAELLRTYARTQRKDGRPYVAEAANPFTGSWEGHDAYDHSEHYFHSAFADLVITGLAGLRPRADSMVEVNPLAPEEWAWWALDDVRYHGHRLTILWDRDGTRYRRGRGLIVLADGRVIARRATIGRIVAPLGAPRALPAIARPGNLAVNNGRGAFPWVTASSTAPGTSTHWLVDGSRWYHRSPPNRWASTGGNARDWIVLDFGVRRRVDRLVLYFLADSAGVRPPARYAVETWDGARWIPASGATRAPQRPLGRRPNVVTFARPLEASRLRVTFTHRAGASTGLTEVEAWADSMALPLAAPTATTGNLAYGARATASFTGARDRVGELVDMRVAFSRYSRNRWTAFGTRSASDWVELDLGAPRDVGRVELYLWGDDRGVKAPARYAIQWHDGARWVDARERRRVPARPMASAVNTVWIEPVRASRLRVVLEHDRPAASGLTELTAWAPEPADPR